MKSMKMIKKQAQAGFTLIELMIVVAIIGILAAVAIPAYQDYILKAKWSTNIAAIDAVKQSTAQCMMNSMNDGALCDTFEELNAYGFTGTALPTPPHATGAMTSTGAAGKVTFAFTGNAAAGGYVYSADCKNDAGGNFTCLAIAADTIEAKAGWKAEDGSPR